MSSKNYFYVTTPIYYATAKPHLGSLYSTLLADVLSRVAHLSNKSVFFLTGTDEHGQKIANAAALAHTSPKEFVDSFIPAFKNAWKIYNIEYTRFMRTTDPDHGSNVQKLIRTLQAQGDVYKGSYSGWYCIPCETFLTEKESSHTNEHATEKPLCPSCNRATSWIKESTYFFKLSAYQEKLLSFYKNHPEFITPKERAQEVIKFIKAGLKDISISRTTVKWGVPFPDDPEHTLYVWIEALCNYITAIGYGQQDKNQSFNNWWPADMQVMAKDIIRFHGVFWPALLMAAQLPLPKQLLVHGWIKVNQQKMSKSLGNAIDPVILAQSYHPECIRYFMIRHLPVNQDGEFSIQALENAITADLANDLGNLANRMILLAEKNNHLLISTVNKWSDESIKIQQMLKTILVEFNQYIKDVQLHLAYARVWHFINMINSYFHSQEPWKVAKKDTALFNEILSTTAHALYAVAILCWPLMPKIMEKLLTSLGHKLICECDMFQTLATDDWLKTFSLSSQGTLFVKPIIEKNVAVEENNKEVPANQSTEISIEQFRQCELRAGTVIHCEPLPNADKLLQLTVSFGAYGERQILSGIKKWYTPEQLIGKQFVFLYNLKARAMVGINSHGMILCASNTDGMPIPIGTVNQVPDGSLLG